MNGSKGLAPRCGVDTSILVRLVAREPPADYERCLSELDALVNEQGYDIFASSQAIGEAYAALVHHYPIDSADARAGLLEVLTGGLVSPLNGQAVLDALSTAAGPGLFDRLIINDYAGTGMETLTLDRQMASLPGARRL